MLCLLSFAEIGDKILSWLAAKMFSQIFAFKSQRGDQGSSRDSPCTLPRRSRSQFSREWSRRRSRAPTLPSWAPCTKGPWPVGRSSGSSRSERVIHWLAGLALDVVGDVGVTAWADRVRGHNFAQDSWSSNDKQLIALSGNCFHDFLFTSLFFASSFLLRTSIFLLIQHCERPTGEKQMKSHFFTSKENNFTSWWGFISLSHTNTDESRSRN